MGYGFYAWADALSHLKKKGFISVFQFVFILIFQHTNHGYENKRRFSLVFSFCFHLAWGQKRT
ncbi:hypothetical protein FO521_25670 [Bacillus pseudomycoides]|nr:hypothetical protein [Bacillus pseudomycoides]